MSLNFLVFNEREAHDSDIFSFSVHGNSILSTSSDGTVKSWDLTTNDLISAIKNVFDQGGHSIASAENVAVGIGFTGDLKVIDISKQSISTPFKSASGEEDSAEDESKGVDWCVAISPDGTTVATTSSTGYLKVYDLASSSLVASIATRGRFGMCIDYAPNNSLIATGHTGGGLFLFDTVLGKLKHSLSHLETVRHVRFSPSSEIIATVGDSRAVVLHDTRTGEQLASITGHGNVITCVDWNASGELLVTGSIDGRVKVWNVPRKECVGTFTENVGHKVWCVRWCKMGNSRLEGFVVGGSEKVLRFYLPTTT